MVKIIICTILAICIQCGAFHSDDTCKLNVSGRGNGYSDLE